MAAISLAAVIILLACVAAASFWGGSRVNQASRQEQQFCVRPVSEPEPVDLVHAAVSVPAYEEAAAGQDMDADQYDEDRFTSAGAAVRPRNASTRRKEQDASKPESHHRSARLVLRDVEAKQ